LPDVSAELVLVYQRAVAKNEHPVSAIAQHFKISMGAAKARLYRARSRGLLPPAEAGAESANGRTKPRFEPEEKIALDRVFRAHFEQAGGPLRVCTWCHGIHERACPAVRRVRFSDSGERVVEIEFKDSYDDENIIWASDLEFDDEEGSQR
jgi:hypothetical protein